MSLGKSPYVGTWKLNNKDVVQHSPDCLVYLNGDLTVPGSSTRPEMRKINIQPYITGVSVDAGTDAGGSSASISLSLPVHMLDSVVRDAQYIFHPGLEVHIYMRGYFPVRGLFRGYGDDIEAFDENGKRISRDDVTISANQEYVVDTNAPPPPNPVAGVPQVNYADLYKDHRMEEWNHLGNNPNARAVPKSPASGYYDRRMTDIRQIVLHETAGWGSSD